ncbi:unnamed protein product [Bursaphelenchus xylophilus]|uniref:(pine wood nematode) hypothetical protein n=1 Tax=Bursaphelenchus xylophilus TaxID=6326 RepID=A0A1I7SC87_BURXY|nr:unnamed protein product [Bursaphelenchus xylophilus]CAG9094556.1 unnamed protein product [Bursaphelenchus xylophilus]
MVLNKVYAVCSILITIISSCLCSAVIYISYHMYKHNRKLEYTFIMAFNAVVDMLYSLVFSVPIMSSISVNYKLYILIENPWMQRISTFSLRLLIMLQGVMALAIAACNAVHFYYRYRMLCKEDAWSKTKYTAVYMVIMVYIFVAGLNFSFGGYDQTAESVEEVSKELPMGSLVPRHLVIDQKQPMFYLVIFSIELLFLAEYGVIIFCGIRIVQKMRQRLGLKLVSSTRKVQRYVVKVMILQALYPLLVYFIPIIFATALLAMGTGFRNVSCVVRFTMQLLSALNCISVLILIPAYRNAIFSGSSGRGDVVGSEDENLQ